MGSDHNIFLTILVLILLLMFTPLIKKKISILMTIIKKKTRLVLSLVELTKSPNHNSM